MEAVNPQPSKPKSKKRKKKNKQKKGINSVDQMTNPHATLDVSSPIFLPSEAETSEVIQKEGIRHTFGSILLAPFSFLFLLLRLFNATVRCSLLPPPPPPPHPAAAPSSTFAHESSFRLVKREKPASSRKVVVTLDVSLLIRFRWLIQ